MHCCSGCPEIKEAKNFYERASDYTQTSLVQKYGAVLAKIV
jgi:hypothetical protein